MQKQELNSSRDVFHPGAIKTFTPEKAFSFYQMSPAIELRKKIQKTHREKNFNNAREKGGFCGVIMLIHFSHPEKVLSGTAVTFSL